MAIKIIDSISTRVGLSLANTVATVSGSYRFHKTDGVYTAEAPVFYYVDETQYAAKNYLEIKHIQVVVSVDDISSNILGLIYTQLKSQYSSTLDI
jgi:hypothetical protein